MTAVSAAAPDPQSPPPVRREAHMYLMTQGLTLSKEPSTVARPGRVCTTQKPA